MYVSQTGDMVPVNKWFSRLSGDEGLRAARKACRTYAECSGEAGRRRRRGIRAGVRGDHKSGQCQGTFGWGWQAKGNRGNQLEFRSGLQNFFGALGFFTFSDKMAQFAGMLAVESLFDGGIQGIRAGKVDGHADPGKGLQQGPMPTDDADEREHDCKFAQPL